LAEHGTWKLAVKTVGLMKSQKNRPMSITQLSSIVKVPEDTLAPALQQLESTHLALASEQGWALTKAGETYAEVVKQNRRLLGLCVAFCTLLLLLIVSRSLG